MKRIFKYPLAITDSQSLLLPIGAKFLSVQFQGELLCLWALVDPEERNYQQTIRIIGTGHPITDSEYLQFIGTVQQFDGQLVWHIFSEE